MQNANVEKLRLLIVYKILPLALFQNWLGAYGYHPNVDLVICQKYEDRLKEIKKVFNIWSSLAIGVVIIGCVIMLLSPYLCAHLNFFKENPKLDTIIKIGFIYFGISFVILITIMTLRCREKKISKNAEFLDSQKRISAFADSLIGALSLLYNDMETVSEWDREKWRFQAEEIVRSYAAKVKSAEDTLLKNRSHEKYVELMQAEGKLNDAITTLSAFRLVNGDDWNVYFNPPVPESTEGKRPTAKENLEKAILGAR